MILVKYYLLKLFKGIFKISENEPNLLILNEEGKSERSYTFTQVFGPLTQQREIFDTICSPLLKDLFENKKSGLIFAYGITNSGKTFTITGIIQFN